MNILLVCFVIGAIVSIILWSMEDSKGESGLGGTLFAGITGGIGCLYYVIPILLLIGLISYLFS